jgi:hypothetical protein
VARFLLLRAAPSGRFLRPTLKGESMRSVTSFLAAFIVVLGMSSAAQAQTIRLSAVLSGANEIPGVVSGSFGTAEVTWDVASQTMSWIIDVFNMPSGTNNAHFHVGGPGVSGPVVVNITFPAQISNDYRLTGSATAANLVARPDQGIRSWQDLEQSLLGGQLYINIHSNLNPGGEIRGKVLRLP